MMTVPEGIRSKLCGRLPLVLISFICMLTMSLQSRSSRSTSATTAFSVISASHITISVRGHVHHPGIHHVSDNLLTGSVIRMANPDVAITSWFPRGIETAPLVQGTEITVSISSDGAAVLQVKPLPVSQKILLGIQLDINMMQLEDFIGLPGIGPAVAKKIITYRQNNGGFMRVQDLLSVDGIGEKRYEQLKKYF